MFPLKIVGDDVRFALAAPEVASDFAHQLCVITRPLTAQSIAFDILVEQFIRVQLRTITGQEDQPNPLLIVLDPVFHLVRAVDRVTVNNEIDSAITLAEQAPEKLQENLGSEALLEHHEI